MFNTAKRFITQIFDLAKRIALIRQYQDACNKYHIWYYETGVWSKTTFAGHACWKAISDLWNYQEIIFELKPSLIVEFGSNAGGSALFFSHIARIANPNSKVLSVDVNLS